MSRLTMMERKASNGASSQTGALPGPESGTSSRRGSASSVRPADQMVAFHTYTQVRMTVLPDSSSWIACKRGADTRRATRATSRTLARVGTHARKKWSRVELTPPETMADHLRKYESLLTGKYE
jgi:hypothetical protein